MTEIEREEMDRNYRYLVNAAANRAKADYAEFVAGQCRKLADEHPSSAEAETLQMVARFATRDAERYREKYAEVEVEEELRWTDLDELAERLTQK